MNFEQYINESKRTMIDMGKEKNLLHASFGLITELGELVDIYKRNIFYGKEIDLINVKEELGDIMWYLAIIYREYDYKTGGIKFFDYFSIEGNLLLIQNTITDLSKLLFEESTNCRIICEYLKDIIISFGRKYNFTLEDILETNINKLRYRFPEKFTNKLALNRNLDEERKILEANKSI